MALHTTRVAEPKSAPAPVAGITIVPLMKENLDQRITHHFSPAKPTGGSLRLVFPVSKVSTAMVYREMAAIVGQEDLLLVAADNSLFLHREDMQKLAHAIGDDYPAFDVWFEHMIEFHYSCARYEVSFLSEI
jgi:hypothetical protein